MIFILQKNCYNIIVKIKSITKSNRRTILIKIAPDGGLIIRAPHGVSQETINKAIADSAGWIEKQSPRVVRQAEKYKTFEGMDGEILYYLGNRITVMNSAVKRVTLEENVLFVPASGDGKALVERWYKKSAKEYLTLQVEEIIKETGLARYTKLSLSSARTKWGSCNSKGEIRLSYRLIMLPKPVIDYVIVHELCHIKHCDHSKNFWSLVEASMPEYKRYKQWLKDNNGIIRLI